MIDTSSFFWLGLVGSVFAGLILTIFRARRPRHVNMGPPRPVSVKPVLWDAYISQDTQYKLECQGDVDRWNVFFPLSVTSLLDDQSHEEKGSAKPATIILPFVRRPTREDPHITTENAQVSTIILLPSELRSLQPHDSSSQDRISEVTDSNPPLYEYAIGTVSVAYHGHD